MSTAAQDPANGCQASADLIASQQLWDSYHSYIQLCMNLVIGDATGVLPQCKTDADCMTSCEVSFGLFFKKESIFDLNFDHCLVNLKIFLDFFS